MLGKYLPQVDRTLRDGRPYLKKGLEIARELENKNVIAAALGGLGVAAETRGELQAAQAYFQEALDHAQASGNKVFIANQLNYLGEVAYHLGQARQARSYYERSLALIEQYGYRSLLGSLKTNLGVLIRDERNFLEAARHFKEAIQIEYELEQVGALLMTLGEVAELELRKETSNQFLPLLIGYLINHPLATPELRNRVRGISDAGNIEVSPQMMAEAAARSLAEVIAIVSEAMLDTEDPPPRSE
jgi:tetratricopeptide (TPR) repeat protein